ncbi:AEC family transporter [uncultured Adlercreutzia sp.]|uniref:AEC family transporter n=1 Tax=uncultured Adlercreutzia sp. TaxID=875803 RepID=UPI0025CF4CE8|nr:AEC family transporter [uncultured Adlercreutzia sp.]
MGDIGNILLSDILPIFVIMILGYLGGRLHKFDHDQMQGLNKVVLDIALPAALFVSITGATREMLFSDLTLTLVSLGVVIGMFLLSFLLCWKVFKHNIAEAGVCALIAGSPTIGFLGYAVLDPVFGTGTQTGLVVAIVAIVVNAITIPIGMYLVNKGENQMTASNTGKTKLAATGAAATAKGGTPAAPAKKNSSLTAIVNALKQPVVWVPLLAVAIVLVGIRFPKELYPCFDLIAKANSGLAVFAAGIALSTVKFSLGKEILWNTFYRNLLTPAVGLVIGLLCGIHGEVLQMFVLAIALPPAFSGIIISSRYNIYVRDGASTVAVSTLAFAATMPLWIVVTPMIEHLFGA